MADATITERQLIEANYYYEIGRYELARDSFLQLVAERPTNGAWFARVAFCEYHLRRLPEAVDHARTALECGHQSSALYGLLGVVYRLQTHYSEADEILREGLSLYPDNVELKAQLAYLLWMQKHRRRAQALLREALAGDPYNQVALYYKLHMARDRRSRQERVEVVERFMQSDVSEVERLMVIVVNQIKDNQVQAALETCRQAYVMDPANVAVEQQLKRLEMVCHPLFFPNRLISRIGRNFYRVLVFVMLIPLTLIHWWPVSVAIYVVLFIIAIWSRLSKPMYLWLERRRT